MNKDQHVSADNRRREDQALLVKIPSRVLHGNDPYSSVVKEDEGIVDKSGRNSRKHMQTEDTDEEEKKRWNLSNGRQRLSQGDVTLLDGPVQHQEEMRGVVAVNMERQLNTKSDHLGSSLKSIHKLSQFGDRPAVASTSSKNVEQTFSQARASGGRSAQHSVERASQRVKHRSHIAAVITKNRNQDLISDLVIGPNSPTKLGIKEAKESAQNAHEQRNFLYPSRKKSKPVAAPASASANPKQHSGEAGMSVIRETGKVSFPQSLEQSEERSLGQVHEEASRHIKNNAPTSKELSTLTGVSPRLPPPPEGASATSVLVSRKQQVSEQDGIQMTTLSPVGVKASPRSNEFQTWTGVVDPHAFIQIVKSEVVNGRAPPTDHSALMSIPGNHELQAKGDNSFGASSGINSGGLPMDSFAVGDFGNVNFCAAVPTRFLVEGNTSTFSTLGQAVASGHISLNDEDGVLKFGQPASRGPPVPPFSLSPKGPNIRMSGKKSPRRLSDYQQQMQQAQSVLAGHSKEYQPIVPGPHAKNMRLPPYLDALIEKAQGVTDRQLGNSMTDYSVALMPKKRKSTIEHGTEYLPETDTMNMLRVRNLSKHIDHKADLIRKQSPRDKVKKFAAQAFGYQEQYIKTNKHLRNISVGNAAENIDSGNKTMAAGWGVPRTPLVIPGAVQDRVGTTSGYVNLAKHQASFDSSAVHQLQINRHPAHTIPSPHSLLAPIDLRKVVAPGQMNVMTGQFRYRFKDEFNPVLSLGQARGSTQGRAETGVGPESGDIDSEEYDNAIHKQQSVTHGHVSQGARTVGAKYASQAARSIDDDTQVLTSPYPYVESKRRSVHQTVTGPPSKQKLPSKVGVVFKGSDAKPGSGILSHQHNDFFSSATNNNISPEFRTNIDSHGSFSRVSHLQPPTQAGTIDRPQLLLEPDSPLRDPSAYDHEKVTGLGESGIDIRVTKAKGNGTQHIIKQPTGVATSTGVVTLAPHSGGRSGVSPAEASQQFPVGGSQFFVWDGQQHYMVSTAPGQAPQMFSLCAPEQQQTQKQNNAQDVTKTVYHYDAGKQSATKRSQSPTRKQGTGQVNRMRESAAPNPSKGSKLKPLIS